jgi:hypothetical protein
MREDLAQSVVEWLIVIFIVIAVVGGISYAIYTRLAERLQDVYNSL